MEKEKAQTSVEYVAAQPAAKPLPNNKLFAIIKWLCDWNFIRYGIKKEF